MPSYDDIASSKIFWVDDAIQPRIWVQQILSEHWQGSTTEHGPTAPNIGTTVSFGILVMI
jgi:hypothetical protein